MQICLFATAVFSVSAFDQKSESLKWGVRVRSIVDYMLIIPLCTFQLWLIMKQIILTNKEREKNITKKNKSNFRVSSLHSKYIHIFVYISEKNHNIAFENSKSIKIFGCFNPILLYFYRIYSLLVNTYSLQICLPVGKMWWLHFCVTNM